MWSLNASIPSILTPTNSFLNETATIRAVREAEYVIYGTAGRNDERGVVPGYLTSCKFGTRTRRQTAVDVNYYATICITI